MRCKGVGECLQVFARICGLVVRHACLYHHLFEICRKFSTACVSVASVYLHTMHLHILFRWQLYVAAAIGTSAALLAGCQSKPVTENVPPPVIEQLLPSIPVGDVPENMLDWAGTYQAILPCHGCPGIAVSVQLRQDKIAVVRERRMGESLEHALVPTYKGAFRFDSPRGSMVTLSKDASEPPAYKFFVSEGWIEMRERGTGKPLSQQPVYRLRKVSMQP